MTKISDRLRATLKDSKPSDKATAAVASSLARPRSAPGIAMFEHQQLAIANAKLEVMSTGKVKISDLHEVEGRKRKLTDEAFAELVANLANNPLMHKIVVQPRPQGGYEIVAGHNRVDAYRQLGREEIEADIREFTYDKVNEAAFYSNLFNSPLTDFEKYMGFKEIQVITDETQAEIANRAGVSDSQMSRLFAFDTLPPEAYDIIRSNPHCVGANAILKLSKAEKDKLIAALTKLANGELTEAQAISFASDAPKPQQIEPVLIRSGKAKYAEIRHKGKMLVINFKNEEIAVGLKDRIEALIRESAEK